MASSEDLNLINLGQADASGYADTSRGSIHRRALGSRDHEPQDQHLPRTDGGTRAWMFLAGRLVCTLVITANTDILTVS